MRSGETDKAVSFKDDKLFELIEKFVNKNLVAAPWRMLRIEKTFLQVACCAESS